MHSLLLWAPLGTKGHARNHLAQGLLPSTSSREKPLPSGHPILSTTRVSASRESVWLCGAGRRHGADQQRVSGRAANVNSYMYLLLKN